MEAGSILLRFGVDTTGLKKGLQETEKSMTSWRDQTIASTRENTKWAAAITASIAPMTAAGAAAYALTIKYGAMADELRDLSYQTGISTTKLQQMQYAATISGTNFGTVSNGINRLTLSMEEAQDPASAAYKAFMGLGVDPKGRSPEEVFDATTAKLVMMQDETKRNSYAMDIYGKSYKEMLPYMEAYITNADEIRAAPIYTEEELKNLEDAKISWDKLTNSLTIYSGKALAFVDDYQTRLNKAINPIYYAMNPSLLAEKQVKPFLSSIKTEGKTAPDSKSYGSGCL